MRVKRETWDWSIGLVFGGKWVKGGYIGEGIKRVTLGMSIKTGHGLVGQGGIARRG